MKILRFLSVLSASALIASAYCADVLLKRSPQLGDESKFHLRAEFEIFGQQSTFTSTLLSKVVKIDEKGQIETEDKQTGSKIKFGDSEQDVPESKSADVTVTNSKGEILEIRGELTDPDTYRMAQLTTITFSDKAIAMGGTWKVDAVANKRLGTPSSTCTYKLDSMAKIGVWDTAVITYEYKETSGAAPASASGKAWINLKDGATVKLESKLTKAPMPGSPQPLDLKLMLERF